MINKLSIQKFDLMYHVSKLFLDLRKFITYIYIHFNQNLGKKSYIRAKIEIFPCSFTANRRTVSVTS